MTYLFQKFVPYYCPPDHGKYPFLWIPWENSDGSLQKMSCIDLRERKVTVTNTVLAGPEDRQPAIVPAPQDIVGFEPNGIHKMWEDHWRTLGTETYPPKLRNFEPYYGIPIKTLLGFYPESLMGGIGREEVSVANRLRKWAADYIRKFDPTTGPNNLHIYNCSSPHLLIRRRHPEESTNEPIL